MKKFITIILFFSNASLAGTALELSKLEDLTCLEQAPSVVIQHSWQKIKNLDLLWVMIEKDTTAIRIAQPSSFCYENSIKLVNCNYYWDRTVSFDNDWLDRSTFKKVKCPNKLNKKNLFKILN